MPDIHDFLPDGLTARPVMLRVDSDEPEPDELLAVAMLVRACEQAVLGDDVDTTLDEVGEMLTSPDNDPKATVLVHDGRLLVAYVWIQDDPTAGETWVDAYVHPTRTELTPGLLEYGKAVARAHRDAAGTAERTARAGSYAEDAPLVHALQDAGFRQVRRFWRMRIDLVAAEAPTDLPDLPPGVEVLDAHDEPLRRTFHEVLEAAFADHWNHHRREYDAWVGSLTPAYDDRGGWWLVTVDGTPAAVCLLDESRREIGEGYVRSLGVLREFRGRGLASALLRRSFAYYRAQGRVGVQLGVDSESPTGAQHLYTAVGMAPARVLDAWAWPVDDSPAVVAPNG